ncbi:uncharacterized protein LOC131239947 [Magnolia sinica]|uniref:uncharacterized protein LOC131239947 n=1 Tax=Magnolia sinica TaxID=86752 RepID=UPI00265ABF8E|nr:uncharacterized protein LOC131239947 [Magnolia sinica]
MASFQKKRKENNNNQPLASTGGLVDTVKEGFTGFQMGSFNVDASNSSFIHQLNSPSILTIPFTKTEFTFHVPFSFYFFQCEAVDPVDVTAIATTIKRTLSVYGTPAFTEMINNYMAQDLSWKACHLIPFECIRGHPNAASETSSRAASCPLLAVFE